MSNSKAIRSMTAVTGLFATILIAPVSAEILFEQDFSSSGSIADYQSKTPSKNQFDLITDGKSGWSIRSGGVSIEMPVSRNEVIKRTTVLEGGPVGAMKVSVDIDFTFEAPRDIRLVTGSWGRAHPNNWAGWGIDSTGIANTWKLAGSTVSFTGAQTLTFFLNDSGTAITYQAPDGSSQSLAFGSWDVWVGTTRVRSSVTEGVKTAADLSGFSLVVPAANSGTGVLTFDNFSVQALTPLTMILG
jgi:hypothetical protein